MDTLIFAAEIECRCDCVNCVTGNHNGCYYEPVCHLNKVMEEMLRRKNGK